MERNDLKGLKVTVMGLGLNGGGIESTRFLAANGADVTVTDLRDESILAPSLEQLAGLPFRAVLGRHEERDFAQADMVIKNPAVRPGNPYVALAKRVETDLSLFFSLIANPVLAVTGSKGKSTTASAIHHGLLGRYPGAKIGGNITISPLSFVDQLAAGDPVVMELSSFQLGDLANSSAFRERQSLPGFPPQVAVVTSIFHDHQDYYKSMPPYIADKEAVFRYQRPDQHAVLLADDDYGPGFAAKARSLVWPVSAAGKRPAGRGAWLEADGTGWLAPETGAPAVAVLPERLLLAGRHHRQNLLQAAVALHVMGVGAEEIGRRLGSFGGVEHRLETVAVWRGVTFVNDSAATIPEAALGAVSSLDAPIHLIAGGTDKALSFELFPEIRRRVASLSLLKGSASELIAAKLAEAGLDFAGPYDDLARCLADTAARAKAGDFVLLSPGCASFGMFLNEFDRGRRFREAVKRLAGG